MPLKQTKTLMGRFGDKIINGTISDDELKTLLAPKVFTKSDGYVDPNKVNDLNHSEWSAILDFVQTTGPQMTDDELHKLTARLIQLAPSHGENTFMRNSTLEKAFLSYEMFRLPTLAEEHFNSDRIKAEFNGENDIKNLKEVILMPGKIYFKKPIIVSEVGDDHENNIQKKMVAKLLDICKAHKEMIESLHHTDTYIQNEAGGFIPDAATQLAKERLTVIERYISSLEKASSIDGALNAFKTDYNNSKAIFTKDNDSIGKLFVSAISCVITKGFKAAFSMWKEGVNAIEGTHEMDEILSSSPKNMT